jgi:hypothetical protein
VGDTERLRRPTPERTGPIRSWAELARRSAGPGAAKSAPPAPAQESAGPEPASEGAPGGANLGYRVIDDYLRQGQETARQIAAGLAGGAGAAGSFQDLSQRLMRDGLLWLEYVAKLWAAADPPGEGRPEPAARPAGGTDGFRVRVRSQAPAEVILDLRPDAAGRSLGIHPLRCPDPEAPPLAGVGLAADDGGRWCVRVHVEDGQPPGVYSGIVYDRRDGTVCGTLAVRLDDGGTEA